jgi:hypothetical protein
MSEIDARRRIAALLNADVLFNNLIYAKREMIGRVLTSCYDKRDWVYFDRISSFTCPSAWIDASHLGGRAHPRNRYRMAQSADSSGTTAQ